MNRSNTVSVVNNEDRAGYKRKIAYHEAGHATGIHSSNAQKNLPPVFFQIIFKDLDNRLVNSQFPGQIDDCVARVKGGRLIQALPMPLDKWDRQTSVGKPNQVFQYTDDYRLALEADIVNLLIGPLAEAKYIALMDDEPFHHQLLSVQALKNYGGEDDLAVVDDYLQSFSSDRQEQEGNLNQLFLQAFNFVNDNANWKAITRLANYILTGQKNRISCEEVAAVLDDE
jgi:hypothetical protein